MSISVLRFISLISVFFAVSVAVPLALLPNALPFPIWRHFAFVDSNGEYNVAMGYNSAKVPLLTRSKWDSTAWTTNIDDGVPKQITELSSPNFIEYNNKIYISNARASGGSATNYGELFIYDMSTNTYSVGAKPSFIVQNPCVAFDGANTMYVISGYNGRYNGDYVADTRRYDITLDLWLSDAASLNIARYVPGCAFDTYLYIFGGEDSSPSYLDSIEEYSAADNEWSIVAATLSVARYLPKCVSALHDIYCIGGHTYGATVAAVDIFDRSSGTIVRRDTQNLNVARVYHSITLANANQCIIVSGGKNTNNGALDSIETFGNCPPLTKSPTQMPTSATNPPSTSPTTTSPTTTSPTTTSPTTTSTTTTSPTTTSPTTTSPTTAGTCTTVADCESHLACVSGVCQRDCTSFIIDDFLNECSTDYPMAVSDIATNAGDIVTNAGDISQNGANISDNAADIVAAESRLTANIGEVDTKLSQAISNNTGLINGVDTRLSAAIAANEKNITDNGNDISINAGQISNNAADIDTNAGDIATNVQSITDNGQNITTNVQSIADNGVSIQNNANAITANAGQISANAVNITSNANDISTNANAINSAVGRITTNEGNIGTNVDDIATNAVNISSNANGITANTNATNAAVTRVSANEENILTNGNNITTNAADIATNVAVDNSQTEQIQDNDADIAANDVGIAANVADIAILYSKFAKFEAQSQLGHAMSEVQSNVTDSVGYSVKDICIVVLVVLNVLSLIAFCVHYRLSSEKSRKYAEVGVYSSGADDVRCQLKQ